MAFTIGLTGGIGSGKSTVMSLFAELGIEAVDADQVVRNLLDSDQQLLEQIRAHFGQTFFLSDGSLDRKTLRAHIFSHESDRRHLEAMIHPLVRKELTRKKTQFSSPYGILIVPLLIESGMTKLVDRVLVIDLPEAMQLERVMRRDGISEDMARQALMSQIQREKRLKYADDIIDNSASLQELKTQVYALHNKYLGLARQH